MRVKLTTTMKNFISLCCAVLLLTLVFNTAYPQGLLNRLKKKTGQKIFKKADEAIDDAIFGKDKNDPYNSGHTSQPGNNSGTNTANTKGGGLIIEPPDVLKNIDEAEQAFGVKNYGSAKYATRQAMLGIEMEIGHNILETLPKSVDGLNVVAEKDQVTSMSYGFVGLMMQRVYKGGDKELRVNIGNNSVWLNAANMMLAGGAYSTTSNDQNYKQTTFKGYRSVLQYDSHSGYTLSVPFGQSSIFVLNGINYESEEKIMSAAQYFDIEPIKKELGEK